MKDFCSSLEASRSGREGRIVFVSSGAVTERARKLLERVPNVRVEKPLDLQKLDEILSLAIETAELPAF